MRPLLCLFVCLVAQPLSAQDDWLAKVSPEGLRVSALQGWTVLETITLPLPEPWKVVASPGGKVVFVLHHGVAKLTLIDGETRRVRGIVPLPAVPEDLWFSEMGYEVGIAWADQSVTGFAHRQGTLDPAPIAPPPRPEPAGSQALVRLHPDEGYACF